MWFLRTFYRHAIGFLGWDLKGLTAALQYIPGRAVDMGRVPGGGRVGADRAAAREIRRGRPAPRRRRIHPPPRQRAVGADVDHRPGGEELEVWGDEIQVAPDRLAQTTIAVDGLRAGTRVRALFEDRELTTANGYFVDDFRGRDLYQRFGGGPTLGYGDAPVALHIYEVG